MYRAIGAVIAVIALIAWFVLVEKKEFEDIHGPIKEIDLKKFIARKSLLGLLTCIFFAFIIWLQLSAGFAIIIKLATHNII